MAGRRIDPTRYTDPSLLTRIAVQARLAWRLLLDERVPVMLKLMIPGLVALYAVSPVDMIPDFLLGFGQLDDIGVILAGIALFVRLVPRHIVEEHRSAMSGQPAAQPSVENPPTSDWWVDAGGDKTPRSKAIDVDYTMDDTGARRSN